MPIAHLPIAYTALLCSVASAEAWHCSARSPFHRSRSVFSSTRATFVADLTINRFRTESHRGFAEHHFENHGPTAAELPRLFTSCARQDGCLYIDEPCKCRSDLEFWAGMARHSKYMSTNSRVLKHVARSLFSRNGSTLRLTPERLREGLSRSPHSNGA